MHPQLPHLLLFITLLATTVHSFPSELDIPTITRTIKKRDLPSWVTSGPSLPSATTSRTNFCFGPNDPFDCRKQSPEFDICKNKYPGNGSDALLQRLHCYCTGGFDRYGFRCDYCMGSTALEASLMQREGLCQGYKTSLMNSGLLAVSSIGSFTNSSPRSTAATTTKGKDDKDVTKTSTDKDISSEETPKTTLVDVVKPQITGNWYVDTETAIPEATGTSESNQQTGTGTEGSGAEVVRPVLIAAAACMMGLIGFL